MILNIDTRDKDFVVTKAPAPKLDNQNEQRSDKETGQPLWMTEVVVTDDSGGEIIRLTTAGEKPTFQAGDPVNPLGLVAVPWATNGRSGIAYRASAIVPFEQ